jgi:two-component system response regulator
VDLTLRAFRKAQIQRPVVHCGDGEKALEYLFPAKGEPPAMPALVLLDLKLPKVDGIEVLKRIRSEPRTRRLPVVILTTSREDRDVAGCYDAGANSYVRKPVELDEFQAAARSLGVYWLLFNEAPPP